VIFNEHNSYYDYMCIFRVRYIAIRNVRTQDFNIRNIAIRN